MSRFLLGVQRLSAALASADQGAEVYTWSSSQRDVAFVTRHQVQEITVHGWDAAQRRRRAVGDTRRRRGRRVDEFLTFSVSSRSTRPSRLARISTGSWPCAAQDVDASWTVEDDLDPGTVRHSPGVRDDAVVIEAPAQELLLWLYRRVHLPGEVTTPRWSIASDTSPSRTEASMDSPPGGIRRARRCRACAPRWRPAGLGTDVVVLDDTSRTAADAAAALKVEVGQIASSIVFVLPDGLPLLVITSGRHRVDPDLVAGALGVASLERADAQYVKAWSGFSIGGVSPVGWRGERPDVSAGSTVGGHRRGARRLRRRLGRRGTPPRRLPDDL